MSTLLRRGFCKTWGHWGKGFIGTINLTICLKLLFRWFLEVTISFNIAIVFLHVRAISKCTLSPCGPCRIIYLITLLRSWSICLRGGPSLLIVIPGKAWLGLLIIIGLSHFPRQLFLKIEVKGGCLVKKWEFGQTKKKFIISIFQN